MKLAILSAVAFLSLGASAHAQDTLRFELPSLFEKTKAPNPNNIKYVNFQSRDSEVQPVSLTEQMEVELSPTYLNAYTTSGLWKQGWFLSASAAASAFVGDPLGCEDLFGRVKPSLQLSLGKWIIPSVGVRLQYQGFELKNGSLASQKYNSVQGDIMFDIASFWYKGQTSPLMTAIPFVGCGMIQNKDAHTHPFSLHYGIIGSLRLSDSFHLNLELSSMNTFKDFDGMGSKCKFGDQLLNASLGLSYTVGNRYSHRRVIDAIPYIEQNHRLISACDELQNQNKYLWSELSIRDIALAEYDKILEIKGWLNRNGDKTAGLAASDKKRFDNDRKTVIGYPYNNYSGLNSLRDRLRNKTEMSNDWNEGWEDDLAENDISNNDNALDSFYSDSIRKEDKVNKTDYPDYLRLIQSHKVCLGAPILFFFELNSDKLTEPSQIANIKEIAAIVTQYDLKVKIIGAADSATGTNEINQNLSAMRADFISNELVKLGVSPEAIRKSAAGGINTYDPSVANRNTRIELYL